MARELGSARASAFATRWNTAQTGNDAYIFLLYNLLLRRTVDPGARAAWNSALTTGTQTRADLADAITSSPELGFTVPLFQ